MRENQKPSIYRYTAEEQREMDSLQRKYAIGAGEGHIEKAREIDCQVTRRAAKIAIVIGLTGTLVFGAGLSLVLTSSLMLPGILIGCVGIAIMSAMPALYGSILRRERRKAALRLRTILDLAELSDNGMQENSADHPRY